MRTFKWMLVLLTIGLTWSLWAQNVSGIEGEDNIRSNVVHVDVDAPGIVQDGRFWETAFTSLQDAFDVVEYGDAIWIADGIYKPDEGQNVTLGNIEETFLIANGISLYGGYAGYGAPNPYLRNTECHRTILSGDLENDDTQSNDWGRFVMNSLHVVTAIGTDDQTLLDGVTVTGGYAYSLPQGEQNGGGMFLVNADMTIQNCTFTQNFGKHGALLYCDGGAPQVSDCQFLNDEHQRGRSFSSVHVSSGSPRFEDCYFSSQSSCGLAAEDAGDMIIIMCEFEGNFGHGLWLQNSMATATMCNFSQNDWSGISCHDSTLDVLGCFFCENPLHGIDQFGGIVTAKHCLFAANRGNWGSGMQIKRGLANAQNCHFIGNDAGIYSWNSGGNSDVELTNCIFSQNVRALMIYGRRATLTNCTLAPSRYKHAGDIWAVQIGHLCTLELFNCIVWEKSEDWLLAAKKSTIDIRRSCVSGNIELTDDNLSADPLFVRLPSPANNDFGDLRLFFGDLRLLPESPCIDMANSLLLPEEVTTDVTGAPRGLGQGVDMGAYENY